MSENELIAVMVPKHHLSKVYGFIAQLDNASTTPGKMSSEIHTGGTDDWTSVRLRRMVHESQRAMRNVLKTLADKAGTWVSIHELIAAISNDSKANWNTLAGVMGAFGRRVKNRYGIDKMPFEKRYDHSNHCKMFRMSKEIASQVIHSFKNGE